MEGLLLVAGWLFVITHLDTLIVLIAFRVDVDYRPMEVLIGHFAGFGIGLGVAVLGTLIAADQLRGWTHLLGLVPLGMGLWGLRRRRSADDAAGDPSDRVPDRRRPAGSRTRVGVVTAAGIGLSGENIAVFVPTFARLSRSELLAVVLLYLVGAGLVFLLAEAIVRRTPNARLPEWIEQLLVPFVLIAVGCYVLATGLTVG